MLSDFLIFWNFLSKPGIIEGNIATRLIGHIPSPLPLKLSAQIVGYPGIKGRNTFQTDLQIVSDLVLEDLARGEEMEDEFLKNCYCSSGALSHMRLLVKISSEQDIKYSLQEQKGLRLRLLPLRKASPPIL